MQKRIEQIRRATDGSEGYTLISIFHDNPQLSKTIGAQENMEILVESSLSKSSVRMLFGKVIFSGTFDPVAAGVEINNVRGNDIILAEVTELICADLAKFPSRMNDGIKELHLRGSSISDIQRQTESITEDNVEAFFAPCTGRVDVILDPIRHDNNTFYPYFEGSRKLAPQFRSHGVGYIRLGDDMSNFGTAFISLNQGKTFLDHGANDAIIMSSAPLPPRSAKKQLLRPPESNDAPSRELLRSAKKVRIETEVKNPEMSKSMPEMKLTTGVLTRAAAKRAAMVAASTGSMASKERSSTPVSIDMVPASTRKRNRSSIQETCSSSPQQVVSSSVSFQSPEPSAKKPKLAESLRRSVRVSRTKANNSSANSLPTPKKLNMMSGAFISTHEELEACVSCALGELQQVDQSGVGGSGWKTKVDIVKRFQQDLQAVSSKDIASSMDALILLRLTNSIRDQIAKTSNPMYTVTVLDLVPTIASLFYTSTTNHGAGVQPSWHSLVSECLQQLRNSNRQIEMAATRALTTLAQQSILTWSMLLQLTESWLGLVPGTTTPKNLLKLNKNLEFLEQRVAVDGRNKESGLFQPPEESADRLTRLVRIGLVAVKDRDEKNRAAGMQLITSTTIAYFFGQHQGDAELSAAVIVDLLSNSPPVWLQEELRSKVTPLIEKSLSRFATSFQ